MFILNFTNRAVYVNVCFVSLMNGSDNIEALSNLISSNHPQQVPSSATQSSSTSTPLRYSALEYCGFAETYV